MKKHPSGSQARKKRKALEQITNQSQKVSKRFLVRTSHPTCTNSISRNDTSPKHSNNTATGKYAGLQGMIPLNPVPSITHL